MIAPRRLVACTPKSARKIEKIKDGGLRKDNEKLLKECRFRNLQDAVNAVKRKKTTIYMLPGVYREKPYRKQPKCGHKYMPSGEEEGAPILSYEQQLRCKHHQNLIGIFGDNKPTAFVTSTARRRESNSRRCCSIVAGRAVIARPPERALELLTESETP